VTNDFADDVPLDKLRDFELGLLQFMRTVHPEIGQAIRDETVLTDQIMELLDAAIQEYKQTAVF
jgi:F-type H+-transporting ATPase subunit alpha